MGVFARRTRSLGARRKKVGHPTCPNPEGQVFLVEFPAVPTETFPFHLISSRSLHFFGASSVFTFAEL